MITNQQCKRTHERRTWNVSAHEILIHGLFLNIAVQLSCHIETTFPIFSHLRQLSSIQSRRLREIADFSHIYWMNWLFKAAMIYHNISIFFVLMHINLSKKCDGKNIDFLNQLSSWLSWLFHSFLLTIEWSQTVKFLDFPLHYPYGHIGDADNLFRAVHVAEKCSQYRGI